MKKSSEKWKPFPKRGVKYLTKLPQEKNILVSIRETKRETNPNFTNPNPKLYSQQYNSNPSTANMGDNPKKVQEKKMIYKTWRIE